MYDCTVYDAFTGISPFEKLGVIKFLESYSETPKEIIQQSVDYAVKDCPSFGGYILSVNLEKDPIAVAVINKTGIPGLPSKNILVQFCIERDWRNAEFFEFFFGKLLELTNQELSIQIERENPYFNLLTQVGFVPQSIEMTYSEVAAQRMTPKKEVIKAEVAPIQRKKSKKRKRAKLRVAV